MHVQPGQLSCLCPRVIKLSRQGATFVRKGRTEWHSGAGPRQASGLPASFLRRARGSASSQLLPQTRAGSPSHSGAISELTLVHPTSVAGIAVRPDPPSSPCGDPRGQRAVPPPECSPFGVRLPSVSSLACRPVSLSTLGIPLRQPEWACGAFQLAPFSPHPWLLGWAPALEPDRPG